MVTETSHPTNFNYFKIIEIVESMISGHNGITLHTDNRKISGESPDICKLGITLPSNPWAKEVMWELENTPNGKMKTKHIEFVECTQTYRKLTELTEKIIA